MTTRHTTEALARKAARRLGREKVYVTQAWTPLRSTTMFVVIACELVLPLDEEFVLYQGPGYVCPREVA